MKISMRRLAGQQGIVLFTSLTILTVLLAVGIGIRTMLQNDFKVLTNLRGGTEVFYISAAGIEWSKNEISRTPVMPPAPENRTVSFQAGSFSVVFLSPTQMDPLAASVVVRSTGMLRASSHIIQAQLTKSYDLSDAALSIRGSAGQVNLGSSPVFISGSDYDPATGHAVAGAKPRLAISASDETLRALIQNALDSAPQTVLDSASASPGLATSGHLPAASVAQLADHLCSSGSAVVTLMPPSGSVSFENQTWGNPTAPELRCFEGLSTPGDTVTLTGDTAGAGILIVRNADLILAGAMNWEGLILITGGEVGLRASGPANKEIIGGILINETASPTKTTAILDIQGSFRLRFSRKTLARAAGLVSSAALDQVASALPFVITQNYWRTVEP